MEESISSSAGKEATHDRLIALVDLVEEAAARLRKLQAENLQLKRDLGACATQLAITTPAAQAETANSETSEQQQTISRLEHLVMTMKDDADRYRWLRDKFSNSIFFSHIESSYLRDHPPGACGEEGEQQPGKSAPLASSL